MKVFAKFDEIPSMTFQDIMETKRYGHTFVRSDGWTDGQRENSSPPTNTVCGGYNKLNQQEIIPSSDLLYILDIIPGFNDMVIR